MDRFSLSFKTGNTSIANDQHEDPHRGYQWSEEEKMRDLCSGGWGNHGSHEGWNIQITQAVGSQIWSAPLDTFSLLQISKPWPCCCQNLTLKGWGGTPDLLVYTLKQQKWDLQNTSPLGDVCLGFCHEFFPKQNETLSVILKWEFIHLNGSKLYSEHEQKNPPKQLKHVFPFIIRG